VLAADQKLAVGSPCRRVEQAVVLVADLNRVGAVGRDGPQVVAAATVGGEGDPAAVRRPARLDVPGHARGDAGGDAAGDRHAVQVAEQREHQLAAVRGHVDVHPGAFVGFEGNGLGGAGRIVDV